MDFTKFSGITFLSSETDPDNTLKVVVIREDQHQQALMAQQPTIVDDSSLTDAFLVNMVDGMEKNDTYEYDLMKLAPEGDLADLLPMETYYDDINTSAPIVVSTENFTPLKAFPEGVSESPSPVSSPSRFESSQFSPVHSPVSPSFFIGENPGSILSTVEESIELVVSPSELFLEEKKAPGKKRGRKSKSERALHQILSQQGKTKKQKVYEINQPFADKDKERKRLNAVNAKRHRDIQKQARHNLESQLEGVKAERDNLKEEVEKLRASEAKLLGQLELYKNHIKAQQNSALTLLQSTSTF